MQFTLASILLMAGLAAALPASNPNAQQDAAAAKNTNQVANKNANASANDGSGVRSSQALEMLSRDGN